MTKGVSKQKQQVENLQAPLSYREEDDMTLISLTEYARMHDKEAVSYTHLTLPTTSRV